MDDFPAIKSFEIEETMVLVFSNHKYARQDPKDGICVWQYQRLLCDKNDDNEVWPHHPYSRINKSDKNGDHHDR